jgi:hypothetical protein
VPTACGGEAVWMRVCSLAARVQEHRQRNVTSNRCFRGRSGARSVLCVDCQRKLGVVRELKHTVPVFWTQDLADP